MKAHIYDKHERWDRALSDGLELVLYGCVLRYELRWEVGLCDVLCVVGGEVVAGEAEGTRPELAPEVYLTEWVEKGGAALSGATDRIVGKGGRGVGNFFKGSV